MNKLTSSIFNFFYFNQQFAKNIITKQYYDSYFFPLDGIKNWNRAYGISGFYEYQCIIPHDRNIAKELVSLIAKSDSYTWFGLMKIFGDIKSCGLLSFPRKGISLIFDLQNRGKETLDLMGRMDSLVLSNDGILNPAKDSRIPKNIFYQLSNKIENYVNFIDPKFSSNFQQRYFN